MDPKHPQPERAMFDDLPDAIRERLRQADRRVSLIDPATDRAVIERARAYFAARGEDRVAGGPRAPVASRHRRLAAGLAAAAVIVAALLIVRPADLPFGRDPDDVDRSGRVDILDAFALARMRAAGEPVSQAEIDALAARVVALDPSRSGS